MSGELETQDYPEKLPDYLMVKHLSKEVGKLSSYIEELEYELQKYKTITPEELRELKKDQLYKKQQEEKRQLEVKIRQLRKDNENLIIKLNKPK